MQNSSLLLNLLSKVTPRSIDSLGRKVQTQALSRGAVNMFETAEVRQSANLEGVYSTRNNPIRLDRQIDGRTGRAVNWNVFGSNGDDCVWCGDGDDTIWGVGGFDRIDAGNGRNTIYASVGGGVYSGGEDIDTFYMPEGNDRRNIFNFGGVGTAMFCMSMVILRMMYLPIWGIKTILFMGGSQKESIGWAKATMLSTHLFSSQSGETL